jgi:predicted TIM-barrel fold metal-dependent hydrolase
MILDGHIHNGLGEVKREDFLAKTNAAGISGGTLLSISPNMFRKNGESISAEKRLDNLFEWAGAEENYYPFFWINPMEADALDQVKLANSYGVKGFKVIHSGFYPGDEKPMEVYRAIAKSGKPMLFHSGILWDGMASAKFNRPGEFEALLEVEGLRFALAHVSWPWFDECIAVYGKFLNAYHNRKDLSVEMFIDVTPGTPPIYREEVLTKLFTVGYDIENNIFFGVDCSTNDYGSKYASEWIRRDNWIYEKLNLSKEIQERVYQKNLQRFIGVTDETVTKTIPVPGE